MLIRCPKCAKEYLLNFDNLPQPKLLQGQGEGWWMSCANCKHQWWQRTKTASSFQDKPIAFSSTDAFQNYTNLQGLQRNSQNTEQRQEKIAPEFYKPFNKDKTRNRSASSIPEEITAVATRILKTDNKAIKKTLSSPRVISLLLIAFLLCALGALTAIYKDQLPTGIKELIFPPQSSLATTTAAPLVLQNVKYGVQATADGKIALTVVGEILNDNPSTVTLLPVRVVVWSYCPENNGNTQTIPTGPNCIKADWQHPWTRPHILPGERLWFQTGIVLPADTQIVRVDVTLP